jgi:hypothetical protein
VTGIATVGMAFLFFLAGLEIELEAIRGKPLRLALAGWIAWRLYRRKGRRERPPIRGMQQVA